MAGHLSEAEKELCSLPAVCARAKSGIIFQQLSELGLLQQQLINSNRVTHYCRWIMRDAHSLSRSPASVGSCSTQPLISIVRQDLSHLKKMVKPCVIGSPKSWSCGNVLGGLSDFGADLNVLQGHSGGVYGVSFSPNSAVLASCSDDKTIRLWDSFTGEKKKKKIFCVGGQFL
jgi:WD40 repeat protein